MEKTIHSANESLLKKRKENQNNNPKGKEFFQKLQSKIDKEGIEVARSEALLRIYTVGRDIQEEIIEMFRTFEIPTFQCIQCKRETEHEFYPFILQYDSKQTLCDDCMKKADKVIEDQKLTDKMKALEVFESKHDALIDIFVKQCEVPDIFLDAKTEDLEGPITEALKAHTSYFITGDVGVGKTHIAIVLLRKHIESIKPQYDEQRKEYLFELTDSDLPIFIEVPELLLRIRDTYRNKNEGTYINKGIETEKDIIDYYTKTPLLILDDLGPEKASDFSTLMLYLILNRRYSNRLTTIITSNLSLGEIEDRLSERISSRIRGMCKIIHVTGRDRRFKESRG